MPAPALTPISESESNHEYNCTNCNFSTYDLPQAESHIRTYNHLLIWTSTTYLALPSNDIWESYDDDNDTDTDTTPNPDTNKNTSPEDFMHNIGNFFQSFGGTKEV